MNPVTTNIQPLIVVADAAGDGEGQGFAYGFDGDAVEHLLEESSHDGANGLLASVASALSVDCLLYTSTLPTTPYV